MTGPRHQRLFPSRRTRRARLIAGLAAIAVVVPIAVGVGLARPAAEPVRTAARNSAGPHRGKGLLVALAGMSPGTKLAAGAPAVEAGELPWQLAAPISREVVLSGAGADQLVIAGGLDGSGTSVAGIFALDTATGALRLEGGLPSPTHDAAGATLAGRSLVFGGGTAAPSAGVQRFVTGGPVLSSGSLPEARADATAVTIGATAFVIGGYNGPSLDAEVLATTDGLHFSRIATLPVPVRYPAAAALDGKIYVFGGESGKGQPVRAVQVVDPKAGSATVVGELPRPIEAAVAVNLAGTVYVAGGATTAGTSSSLRPAAGIYAFDAADGRLLRAGSLPVPVSNAAVAVLGTRAWVVGGELGGGTPTAAVQVLEPNPKFGTAGSPGAGSPLYGEHLLVADRGNDRLLVLDDANQVVWAYPSRSAPPPPGGFYFPDDAFFVRHGTAIISNQEENETLVELAYPSGRVLWSYGHPRLAGSAPGYLDNPDDAYLLKNGDITVADPKNCRVLVISPQKRVLSQIGTIGACAHDPPSELGSPNGDTPLADGDLLISEINGSWVDEYTPQGRLIWDVELPIGYPSDPQQIGPDAYLVADYEDPGAIVVFNRQGRVLYRYQPLSGAGELNRPSLVELLPSGVFMLNDDYNDRLVAIDPGTGALVWQYGVTGEAGAAAGLLDVPDGFDVLGPGGSTPTHTATG
ncbi:MAG: PQQ-binding-like beta-propeller repeat protein [Acidimicrobiales bacterium]